MNTAKRESPVKKALLLLAITAAVLLLLCRPRQGAEGVLRGLSLCYRSIIPSLFPFFIVTYLVMNTEVKDLLGKVFSPYLRCLGIPLPAAGSALLLGVLGGFAVGADSIGELCRQKELDPGHASLLLCAAINSGPAFVVTAVGYSMLGSSASGVLLLVSLLAASLITGALMGLFWRLPPCTPAPRQGGGTQNAPLPTLMVKAIGSAVSSTLNVCGFIVFFSLLYSLSAAALQGWPGFAAAALLEVTGACAAALETGAPLYACAAALSLLGCSIFMQVRSLLPEGVSLRPLLLSRLIHLPLTMGILFALTRLFPEAAVSGVIQVDRLLATNRLPPDAGIIAFLFCLLFVCELSPSSLFQKKHLYTCEEIPREEP